MAINGSIKFLKNKKNNQYAVHPPTTEFNLDGSPKTPKALCYVPDWYTGFAVLTAYKAGTYQPGMERTLEFQGDTKGAVSRIIADYSSYRNVNNQKGLTFSEVFDRVYDEKFIRSPKQYSKGYSVNMKSAFKRCNKLHDMEFSKITLDNLQEVMDSCTLKHASLEGIKALYNALYQYAIPHGIAEKDLAKYVKINKPFDDTHGVPFTIDQLTKIASYKDNQTAVRLIVMCFSGFRIREYEKARIFPDRIIGGSKTKAGKDRTVPIHSTIAPLMDFADMNSIKYSAFLYHMKRFLSQAGIEPHTPHDTRHTFSMLCDKYKVHPIAKKKMMGHSLAGDMSNGTYGHWDYDMLKSELEKVLLTFY